MSSLTIRQADILLNIQNICEQNNLSNSLEYTLHYNYFITYIHNWPLQSFSRDYSLASHTTHVVCVNFIREWWTLNCGSLQFNVDSERRSFKKLFHGRFIYSQSFWQKCVEKKSPKKYFSYFIFDDWPVIWTQTFASNKSPLYLLDHGDFNII